MHSLGQAGDDIFETWLVGEVHPAAHVIVFFKQSDFESSVRQTFCSLKTARAGADNSYRSAVSCLWRLHIIDVFTADPRVDRAVHGQSLPDDPLSAVHASDAFSYIFHAAFLRFLHPVRVSEMSAADSHEIADAFFKELLCRARVFDRICLDDRDVEGFFISFPDMLFPSCSI